MSDLPWHAIVRRVFPIATTAALIATLVLGYLLGFFSGNGPKSPLSEADTTVSPLAVSEAEVNAFCGSCHAVPKADSFPKSAWYREVQRGYDFHYASGRTDIHVPPQAAVTEFFRRGAPDKLLLPPALKRQTAPGIAFRPVAVVAGPPSATNSSAGVANLRWFGGVMSEEPSESSFFVSDMRSGELAEWRINAPDIVKVGKTFLGHPAHVERTDLDGDGVADYVVADLGSFLPEDHDRGRVLWVRKASEKDFAEPVILAEGLGRVADAETGDFNGDGILDLVVAEFGWQRTGRVLLLISEHNGSAFPVFNQKVVDKRHGAIHVRPIDLNEDGRLDFVALISQEHEKIEAFINQGDERFEIHTLFAADDPAFGSSGIELVDLDQDGDQDILYTNGDMYDSFELKPYHGIHWLENTGLHKSWKRHTLAQMPGVHCAATEDFNGDGRLDIVACASVPTSVAQQSDELALDSVILLLHRPDHSFAPYPLETGMCSHPTLEVGDFDADGDVDFAVGNLWDREVQATAPFSVWWNQRISN